MTAAQSRGQIKTLLGRRCRFPKYEPILRGSDWGKFVPAQDEERMKELQEMGPFILDEEGNTIPEYQRIDHSKMIPVLTKALQEAITKIETLETENTDIKTRLTALESA